MNEQTGIRRVTPAEGATTDDELALAIGRWIIETHREMIGEKVCTGFLIDDYEVQVGIVGFAHGSLEHGLAQARRLGRKTSAWRRVFPMGEEPEKDVIQWTPRTHS